VSGDRQATFVRIRAHATASEARATRARRIVDEIRAFGRYRWVGVYDVDEEAVTILGWSGGGAPAHPRFSRSDGLTGRAIARAAAVVVDDVASDPDYLEAFGDTRAETIVPVVVDGGVVGTIDVESDRPNAFRDRDRAFLDGCAAAAVALWRAATHGARSATPPR
jgi:GAF domain-containing protein